MNAVIIVLIKFMITNLPVESQYEASMHRKDELIWREEYLKDKKSKK